MMDVSRALHVKPLSVSKKWSAHPSQQGGELERTIGKRTGGGKEDKIENVLFAQSEFELKSAAPCTRNAIFPIFQRDASEP
jgi:hypothetical protein